MNLLTYLASWDLISPYQNSGLLSDSKHLWTSRYQMCLNAISHLLKCDQSDCEDLHQERFKCVSECFTVEMLCSWLMWRSVCWGNGCLTDVARCMLRKWVLDWCGEVYVEEMGAWLMWRSVCWGNSLLWEQNSNSDCYVCGCLMEPLFGWNFVTVDWLFLVLLAALI